MTNYIRNETFNKVITSKINEPLKLTKIEIDNIKDVLNIIISIISIEDDISESNIDFILKLFDNMVELILYEDILEEDINDILTIPDKTITIIEDINNLFKSLNLTQSSLINTEESTQFSTVGIIESLNNLMNSLDLETTTNKSGNIIGKRKSREDESVPFIKKMKSNAEHFELNTIVKVEELEVFNESILCSQKFSVDDLSSNFPATEALGNLDLI